MVKYVMPLILAVSNNMKLMITLHLCLVPLKKILETNYTYGSLKQPMAKKIMWRVTMLFISHRMGDRGGLFRAKGRLT